MILPHINKRKNITDILPRVTIYLYLKATLVWLFI